MASGTLGTPTAVGATTNTTIYTVPSSTIATFNINAVNTSASAVLIRIAISATATPASGEWIEYDANLGAAGGVSNVLERTALVAEAGKYVVVYASAVGVNVRCHGFEEAV